MEIHRRKFDEISFVLLGSFGQVHVPQSVQGMPAEKLRTTSCQIFILPKIHTAVLSQKDC